MSRAPTSGDESFDGGESFDDCDSESFDNRNPLRLSESQTHLDYHLSTSTFSSEGERMAMETMDKPHLFGRPPNPYQKQNHRRAIRM